ncbi:MAG TPA: hypothetical protein VJU87_11550 [Gemmatimonadaceae bacterium]|nr:hypothetical protein [Gemmatimonadaceae bacterium]
MATPPDTRAPRVPPGRLANPQSRTRRRWLRAGQWLLAVIVLGLAFRALHRNWTAFRAQPLRVDLEWRWIVCSGVLFLVGYAVLVQTWRAMLAAWHARLDVVAATRIWTVSNLGRYVPGKLWSIGAMGVMAQRAGVSPIAASGSAVLSTVVSVAAGAAVVLVTGSSLLNVPYTGAARSIIVLLVLIAIALVLLPRLMPVALRTIERVTGRSLGLRVLPLRAVIYSVIGNVIAWILYGIAFEAFVRGVLGAATGASTTYIAVYALSYLVGYLVLFAPAGVGFREASLIAALPAAHLATPAQAAVIAVASRLWLTVLEIAPGALFLGWDAVRRRTRG